MPIHKTKRAMLTIVCGNCGETFVQRKDHVKRKPERKRNLCPKCSCIKLYGYEHQTGYIIRNYRSYPRQYWEILKPMAKKNTQIKEHRANIAIFLGRPLSDNEVVHHKNGNRKDNRVENLEVLNIHNHCCGFNVQDVLDDNERLKQENKKLKELLNAYLQN